MKFTYTTNNRDGVKVRRSMTAKTRLAAEAALKKRRIKYTDLVKERGILDSFSRIEIGGISFLDKVLFTKHLSVMLKSGLTIDEALDILREQIGSFGFKRVINELYDSVRSGKKLSDGMRQHERVFDDLYVSVIAAGEQSGTLDESLENLSEQMTKSHELRSKVRAAMAYPLFVFFLTIAVGFALAIFVLPKVVPLFTGLNIELPLITRILLSVSETFNQYGVIISLLIVGGLIFVVWAFQLKVFRPIIDGLILRLPVASRISKFINLSLFSRTLAILLKSGITINEALKITADTMRNVYYERAVRRAIIEIQSGKSLSEILETRRDLFPPIVFRMIQIGERSGSLEGVLLYLSDFYEGEVDNVAKTLSTVVEPLLLAIIGLMVGFVAVSIIMPIYQITSGLTQ